MNSAGQGRNRFAISHLPAQFGAEDFSDILPKPPISRIFGKYNHVVRTFVANTADHSFRVRILPGRVGSGDQFFDPHSSRSRRPITSAGLCFIFRLTDTQQIDHFLIIGQPNQPIDFFIEKTADGNGAES
jgi:hypothetical protein